VFEEVEAAAQNVFTEDVYEEEARVHHDIRALVNCLRRLVSDEAKPFIHMTATSYDIVEPANAARYRDVTLNVVVPELTKLVRVLIDLTLREAETPQIGRTHGQHAVPITFGFAMAEYVARLGSSIQNLRRLAKELVGKFSGAVGACNASSLFFEDAEAFEAQVLHELGLKPAEYSTQIAPPEPMTRLLSEYAIAAGILANLCDDMRHLQRTEIGEVGEEFAANQVGSSTMPQKRNPINFENGKGMWRIVAPRLLTVFQDQVSEHQRDLTGSVSGRTYGEVIAYLVSMTKRLTKTMNRLKVDRANLVDNLNRQADLISAEPLYLILAALGHPDAHEKVRTLTIQAQQLGCKLGTVADNDAELRPYMDQLSPRQFEVIHNPRSYTGIAAKKAVSVARHWQAQLEPLDV
jgi:adenylosuccinate lyase